MSEKAVSASIATFIPPFNLLHIKDWYHLGKYQEHSQRPRALQVELNCVRVALQILDKWWSLLSGSTIGINPDLSQQMKGRENLHYSLSAKYPSTQATIKDQNSQKCYLHVTLRMTQCFSCQWYPSVCRYIR